jgi:ABC-2 type transport system ATP-binding protein
MHHPKLLLLDEPEIALDFKAKARFRQLLVEYAEELQLTVLISSHDLGSLEQYCTDYIIMNRGEVIFTGKPEEMRQQFSPKNIIKLKIAEVRDVEREVQLRRDGNVVFLRKNDTILLYVDQTVDLEAIISQCYTAYEVISIDISSNSLEQVLLRTEERL